MKKAVIVTEMKEKTSDTLGCTKEGIIKMAETLKNISNHDIIRNVSDEVIELDYEGVGNTLTHYANEKKDFQDATKEVTMLIEINNIAIDSKFFKENGFYRIKFK